MLHLFLANQSSISNQLKTELHKIVNVEELLLLLIYHCEEHVVATKYVLPNEVRPFIFLFVVIRVLTCVFFNCSAFLCCASFRISCFCWTASTATCLRTRR